MTLLNEIRIFLTSSSVFYNVYNVHDPCLTDNGKRDVSIVHFETSDGSRRKWHWL